MGGGWALRAKHLDNWFYAYLLFNIANALISPLEVLYCRAQFNASMSEIGLLTASYYITLVPATFLWGPLLDKIGRKKEIVAGMFFYICICLYLVAFADSVLAIVIINLLAGLGIAGLGPSATLLIVEQNEPKFWTKKISTFNFIASIGTVIGMISASIFLVSSTVVGNSAENISRLFKFTSVLTFLGAILAFILIRNEKNIKKKSAEFVIILYDRIVEKRRYLPFMLYHLIYPHNI
ncbi:MAG: MFS transporter [Thermoplasmata archaeon]